ncbi:MAG: hypothetical protein GY870_09545 [archaeon]|nr:hypothetical protein [archaeon]
MIHDKISFEEKPQLTIAQIKLLRKLNDHPYRIISKDEMKFVSGDLRIVNGLVKKGYLTCYAQHNGIEVYEVV